ncbi:MAG: aminotransferase class I/II-fold pyridoxal phosphate-dependent enzyme [bacterium]|nr:aminotransferase class I/II-fold pyridoxal phosphate-dependent enzyme [bacterium]
MPFQRTKNINLSPIKAIELKASGIPDVISLAQGIPSFDTPEVIKKAAAKALSRGDVAKYSLTLGLPELRETVEEKIAKEGMFYDFEKEILVTVGSIEAITASLVSAVNKEKDEVLLLSPCYTSYQEAVKVAGGKPVFVELDENKNWQINFQKLEEKINSKTAAILFANPNNPTGTIFPKNDLLKIADLALKNDFFIILDEVYKDFIYDDIDFFTLASKPELRKKVIRAFSFSKAYAMTGWRIGFLHTDEDNVREIVKVHDTMVTCAPVISQYAAIGAFDFADKEIEEFKKQFVVRRDLACRHLDKLSEFLSYKKPSGSYFVFPKLLKEDDSWKFTLDLLEKAHVAVVPGVAFGPNGEGYIRINFGRDEKDINEAFKRIGKYLKGKK